MILPGSSSDSPGSTGFSVAVIGGGITGLAAAWHLIRAGARVTLFEAGARPGGMIGTFREGGWLHELGPNSLLEGSPAVSGLIEGLGLGPRRIAASETAKNRYIIRGGRLESLPVSPLAFARTRLFSIPGKFGLLAEPFRRRLGEDKNETVADFAIRRLGREFLDYAVDPFVAGIFAGDPNRLSVKYAFPKLHALERKHGSLILGAMRRRHTSGQGGRGRMISFPDGLAELPQALANALDGSLQLSTPVHQVRRTDGGWELLGNSGWTLRSGKYSAVVCALPADSLAKLQFEGVPTAQSLKDFQHIYQPPVVSIFSGFRRDEVGHPLLGFGLLVPAVEKGRILGTLFSSSLFAGRAPQGHVALTTFVGGARQPELSQLGDEELLEMVTQELAKLLGVRGPPGFWRVQRWPRAIPQYDMDFGRRLESCRKVEEATPGLFIGGNCRDGISLSDCIESGSRLASAALSYGHYPR